MANALTPNAERRLTPIALYLICLISLCVCMCVCVYVVSSSGRLASVQEQRVPDAEDTPAAAAAKPADAQAKVSQTTGQPVS